MDTFAILLGVNIDHVATLRQARGTVYPRPIDAALLAEQNGADSITVHLREDRRHIQDADIREFKTALQTRMNLEMAVTDEMVGIAAEIRLLSIYSFEEKQTYVHMHQNAECSLCSLGLARNILVVRVAERGQYICSHAK